MSESQTRQDIATALKEFGAKPLADAAFGQFDALGYASQRRISFDSFSAFLSEFDKEAKAAKLFKHDRSTSREPILLQQLTSEEIASGSAGTKPSLVSSSHVRESES